MKRREFNAKHPRMTRSLKEFVVSYEGSLVPEVFKKFLSSLDNEIENARAAVMSAPAGPERARMLHALVEEELRNNSQVGATCFKGCSACCHLEVEVTNYEAEILGELVRNGHPIDEARLRTQSRRELQDPAWKDGPRNGENQCVFLGADKACGIYDHRPVMCRRHAVSSAPANCGTVDEKITICYYPRVDVLIVAANEDSEVRIGPLAKMILLQNF